MGDPATITALIGAGGALGGPVLSQLFAPEGQELSSFEGRGRVDPVSLLSQANWLNNAVGRAVTNRAASPISLPSSYVQQPGAYCLRQHERILTASLEWVPCGDIAEGAQILAFDETAKMGGRSWQPATVTMSKPTKAHCVRVYLENDECITTTADHPWLVESGSSARKLWVRSNQLMQPNKARRMAWKVLKVASPWSTEQGFDAGWLAGIWDGEGSITQGRDNWKAGISQLPGLVSDRFCDHMRRLGFDMRVTQRLPGVNGLRAVNHINLRGDFEELMSMFGRLRPIRLLQNFINGAHLRKLVVKHRLRVVAIESAGYRDIQSITTSARTYIGEGFLMHNTGGGLPMPIGLVASDPALANPSLLSLPGMEDFAGMFDHLEDRDVRTGPGGPDLPDGPGTDPTGPPPTEPAAFAPMGQAATGATANATSGPRRRSSGGNLVRAADLIAEDDGTNDLDQGYGAAQLLLDALREGSTQRTGALI